MTKYIIILLIILTSCKLPSFKNDIKEQAKEKISEAIKGKDVKKGNKLKQTIGRLDGVLNIFAILSLVATIVFMALKNTHFAGISGASCIGSLFLIYTLDWIYVIIASCFWLSLFYGVVKIAMIIKERNEARENEEQLATHFLDPEGEVKLSDTAKSCVLKHRHKGDVQPWKEKIS